MAGVLDGIRVIDFGRYIAGPFATAIMADMGAEVIRVEKLTGAKTATSRRWKTARAPATCSPTGTSAA